MNLVIPANEILIFAGARGLNAGELGRGEKGGFSASSNRQSFLDIVKARGQSGGLNSPETDFGPWGGSVAFSSTAKWHFGLTTDGLDADEFDFVSVASHELLHALGFGLANSWNAKVSGGFTGANSIAVSGKSPVPLYDVSHWAIGTISNGQPALMTPDTLNGARKLPTRLDFAGMQDIGWQLIAQQVQVNASHVYGDNGTFDATLQLNGSTIGTLSIPFRVDVTNVSPKLVAIQNQNAVQGQPFIAARLAQFTDPGFGVGQANPSRAETFRYSINWGDNTPIDTGDASIESLGSPGIDTRGFVSASHVFSQIGNFLVTAVVSDDDGGSIQQQFTISVGPPPSIEVAIDKNSIAEDAGPNAGLLTIKRVGFDISAVLSISLTSSDTSELQLPNSIVIPAGQSMITVPVQAIDDSLLDGTVRVQLAASAGSIISNSVVVDVLDRERVILSLNRLSISENAGAGAAVLTVSRSNSDTALGIVVQLSSSNTREANLPTSVVVPPGASSVNVGVDAIDDAIFDGSQIVVFSAISDGYESATAQITVLDFQPLSIVLQANELNEETPAQQTTQAQISIRSPSPAGGLTIRLTSNAPSQLVVPSSIQILAGSTSVMFPVSVVDDFVPQGRRTVRINGSGDGVIATAVDLVITDNDPAYWTNPILPVDVNNNGDADPLDVLIVINEINRNDARSLDPNFDRGLQFVDVNRDGDIGPLDVLIIINFINSR